MIFRLLLLRLLSPCLYRILIGGFLVFVSVFYLLAIIFMFAGRGGH